MSKFIRTLTAEVLLETGVAVFIPTRNIGAASSLLKQGETLHRHVSLGAREAIWQLPDKMVKPCADVFATF